MSDLASSASLPASYTGAVSELEKAANTAKAGIKESGELVQKATEKENKALDEQAALTRTQTEDRKKFATEHPFPHPDIKPWSAKPPENNPIQRFGSWASAFGILAGALTKTGIASSLNASAAAMNAMRKNDLDAYDEAHQAWKDNTEIVQKQAEWESKAYEAGWQVMEKDQAAGSRLLEIAATQAHNTGVLAALKAGDYEKAFNITSAVTKFALDAPAKFDELGRLADANRTLMQFNEDSAKKLGVRVDQLPPDVRLNNRVKVDQIMQVTKPLSAQGQENLAKEIASYDSVFDAMDQVKQEIQDTAFAVGVGGKLGRPVETVGELLNLTDESTRTRISGQLAFLKEKLPKLLVGASRQPTPTQLGELEKMLGGEGAGSTVQNVTSRLDDMRERLLPTYDVLQRTAGTSPRGRASGPSGGSGDGEIPVGFIAKGADGKQMRFKGGDSKDIKNWSPVSGAVGTY